MVLVSYVTGLSLAAAGIPIIPATGLGVVSGWYKDNGEYDVVKTTGGNIVGSVVDSKLGYKPYSPIVRDSFINLFEKVYEQIEKRNE